MSSAVRAGAPWRTVLAAVTTTTACVMPVFLVGGLAVQIGDDLGFSPAGLGLAVAVYFGVSALTSVPAGALVERLGPVRTARAGIALATVCLLAIAFGARSLPALVGLLGVGAGANALGQLASNATLARLPTRRQGLSFGLKQSAIPAATLLAGLAVPGVALTLGWRWAFVIAAGLAAVALVLVRPLPPPPVAGDPTAEVSDIRQPNAAGAPPDTTAALITIAVAVALSAGAASALGTFLVDSAATAGVSPATAGLTLTLGSVACILGRVTSGWLADRYRSVGDLAAVAVQLSVGAAGLALVAAPGMTTLAIGVLLGFGLGWAFPGLINFAVVRYHPGSPAAATSITQTGVYAGGAVGPLAFGAAAALAGYPTAWAGAGAVMVAAAALTLIGRRQLLRRLADS